MKLNFLSLLFTAMPLGASFAEANDTNTFPLKKNLRGDSATMDDHYRLVENPSGRELSLSINKDGMVGCDWENSVFVRLVLQKNYDTIVPNDLVFTMGGTLDGIEYSHTVKDIQTGELWYEFYLKSDANGKCLTGKNARYGDGIFQTIALRGVGSVDLVKIHIYYRENNQHVSWQRVNTFNMVDPLYQYSCTGYGSHECVSLVPRYTYMVNYQSWNNKFAMNPYEIDQGSLYGCDPQTATKFTLEAKATENMVFSKSEYGQTFTHKIKPYSDNWEYQFYLRTDQGDCWTGSSDQVDMTIPRTNAENQDDSVISYLKIGSHEFDFFRPVSSKGYLEWSEGCGNESVDEEGFTMHDCLILRPSQNKNLFFAIEEDAGYWLFSEIDPDY